MKVRRGRAINPVARPDKLGPVRQRWGNCYAASEALYHILGGKRSGWTPMCVRVSSNCCHWFLKHKATGMILDPSRRQFQTRGWHKAPDYSKARGTGYLTKAPSGRARRLIQRLTWSMDPRED